MSHWPYWVLGLSCVAAAVALWGLFRGERSSREAEIDAELAYQRAQAVFLGELLGREREGRSCALLVYAGDVFAEAFKEGAAGRLGEVQVVEVTMEDDESQVSEQEQQLPRTLRPRRTWTKETVVKLLAPVPSAQLLVVAVPLPEDCFGSAGAPLLPELRQRETVLAAGCGLAQVKAAQTGALLAAVRCREDNTAWSAKSCPKDVRAAFAARYELFSAELLLAAAGQKEEGK